MDLLYRPITYQCVWYCMDIHNQTKPKHNTCIGYLLIISKYLTEFRQYAITLKSQMTIHKSINWSSVNINTSQFDNELHHMEFKMHRFIVHENETMTLMAYYSVHDIEIKTIAIIIIIDI